MQTITDAYRAARQRFVRWAVNWARSDSTQKQDPPDVAELVKMLDAIGYKISHLDVSAQEDVKPIGDGNNEGRGGCRVVAICAKSGLRVVLEASGVECNCPTVEVITDQNNVISPFSEPTALLVREVLKHLVQLDIHSDVNTDDTTPLNSPILSSRRFHFGSVDELRSLKANYRENRAPSNEDISTNCFCNGIRSAHSMSSEAIPTCSHSATLPLEDSTIDRKLKIAMESIKDALTCYYAETRNSGKKSKNEDSIFKVPKSKNGPAKNLSAQKHDVHEAKGFTPMKKDSAIAKDKLHRPSTPHPIKKQVSRIQTPKSSSTTAVTSEVTTKIKSRNGSLVKSTKK